MRMLVITISYRFEVIAGLLFKFWTKSVFEPPLGDLGATYTVHLRLIGKTVVHFLLVLIALFSLRVTAEPLRDNIDWRSAILKGMGLFRPNFQVENDVHQQPFLHGYASECLTTVADCFHIKKLCIKLSSSEVHV